MCLTLPKSDGVAGRIRGEWPEVLPGLCPASGSVGEVLGGTDMGAVMWPRETLPARLVEVAEEAPPMLGMPSPRSMGRTWFGTLVTLGSAPYEELSAVSPMLGIPSLQARGIVPGSLPPDMLVAIFTEP